MIKAKQEIRKKAHQLRQAGYSFGQIAQELNIPRSTVKSWCYRTAEDIPKDDYILPENRCPQCGGNLPPSKFRARRFCSDACRARYWSTHSEQIDRRSAVKAVCPVCHKTFQDYAQRHRKYCSHACYIAARYHGGTLDE